jgi:hypothetical protein
MRAGALYNFPRLHNIRISLSESWISLIMKKPFSAVTIHNIMPIVGLVKAKAYKNLMSSCGIEVSLVRNVQSLLCIQF